MAERVESMGKGIDPKDPNSLSKARATLVSIIADLQSMVTLGSQVQDDSKLGMMQEVHNLLKQTQTLKLHLDRAIQISPSIAAAAKPSPPTASFLEKQVLHDKVPLNRDEIAKLLLLTSRAWKSRLLSDKQRHFVKQVIVRREGYLRVILSFGSIQATMEALAAVGGPDNEENYQDDFDEGEENEDDSSYESEY